MRELEGLEDDEAVHSDNFIKRLPSFISAKAC